MFLSKIITTQLRKIHTTKVRLGCYDFDPRPQSIIDAENRKQYDSALSKNHNDIYNEQLKVEQIFKDFCKLNNIINTTKIDRPSNYSEKYIINNHELYKCEIYSLIVKYIYDGCNKDVDGLLEGLQSFQKHRIKDLKDLYNDKNIKIQRLNNELKKLEFVNITIKELIAENSENIKSIQKIRSKDSRFWNRNDFNDFLYHTR